MTTSQGLLIVGYLSVGNILMFLVMFRVQEKAADDGWGLADVHWFKLTFVPLSLVLLWPFWVITALLHGAWKEDGKE